MIRRESTALAKAEQTPRAMPANIAIAKVLIAAWRDAKHVAAQATTATLMLAPKHCCKFNLKGPPSAAGTMRAEVQMPAMSNHRTPNP
mmetsp:Transcript_108361/g.170929  ORF Transcript_108361/g.170929 Transcript_108361/m.170929 type:complete len:88 (-) Transcript_108361:1031-1294(-)